MTGGVPTVSVIVPVYNGAQFICSCLDSIIGQSFDDFEILLINDGSTDGTGDVCQEYARRTDKLRNLSLPQSGTSVARNHGIDKARGVYLCFVDADDILHCSALQVLVETAQQHNASLVMAGFCRFDYGSPVKGSRAQRYTGRAVMYRPISSRGAFRAFANGQLRSSVWGMLWHREVLQDVRFVPGRRHEDAIFVPMALDHAATTVCIPDCLYYYRNWPGSFMNSLSPARLDVIWAHQEIHDLIIDRYPSARMRMRARATLVSAVMSIWATLGQGLPSSSDETRWWRIRVFSRIPRSSIFRWCLHPLFPNRQRIHGLLLIAGIRPYVWMTHAVRPMVRMVYGAFRSSFR